MLKSHTSSKEEEISYLRKFAQNNNKGCELLEEPLNTMRVDRFASCQFFPPLPNP